MAVDTCAFPICCTVLWPCNTSIASDPSPTPANTCLRRLFLYFSHLSRHAPAEHRTYLILFLIRLFTCSLIILHRSRIICRLFPECRSCICATCRRFSTPCGFTWNRPRALHELADPYMLMHHVHPPCNLHVPNMTPSLQLFANRNQCTRPRLGYGCTSEPR